MESLLATVSTSYTDKREEEDAALVEVKQPRKAPKLSFKATTPAEALEILKNEPDHDSLISTLRYLGPNSSDFSITSPSPLAAQLAHTLVSDIVPNYWNLLYERKTPQERQAKTKAVSDLELLLACLRSVTGLNALLLVIKQLIQRSQESKTAIGGPNIQDRLTILLQVLTELIDGDETIGKLSNALWNSNVPQPKQKAIWNELLSIVGSGKIPGLAAEAEDVIGESSKKISEKYWIANGSAYSTWLARNITLWARSLPKKPENGWKCCGELLCKAFRLGHSGKLLDQNHDHKSIVKEILTTLLLQQQEQHSVQFEMLLSALPKFEQRNFILSFLKLVSKAYLSSIITSEDDSRWWQSDASVIAATAGLIQLVLAKDESRKIHLMTWLTSSSGAGVGDGIAIRRAVIAALATDKNDIETILDKILRQFGDQLYIRHTPTMQQEAHAQVLLLSAGYVHRIAPLRLRMLMRSGTHLSVVSNRLAASSPRARFLGMAIGEALSSLVDKDDKRMDFKMEEMTTPEAKWYRSLVTVFDSVGSLSALKSQTITKVPRRQPVTSQPKSKAQVPQLSGSKIISIEEISSSEDSDDDGLLPYAKPDSDASDSDDDPTLITRNKPIAPIYIRDLITFLRDTESYDKQKLGLQTAASLIRRKANFGTEVSAHAEELATLLIGLQDKYEITDFANLRLQGMIAVLIAQPLKMGQWFSKTFFDGDYSLSQRASVLTTLGLGARELGGFADEEAKTTPKSKVLPSPSKSLPPALHTLYTPSSDEVDALSTQLSNTMIAPMAATLANKITGPSILKIRTFSTRMAVEAKRKKPIANALAKIVAESFFFPLSGRFFIHLKAYGSSSHSNIVFNPFLLTLFIKTLALLIHASGPSTLSLPQMTSEFWDLLLNLRTQSLGDGTVVEALLFAFLTLLEVNEDKRDLVDRHGRQLLETQEWVEVVFGRMGGGEEEERGRMLAAGVLLRINEVVDKYQALLMGDLVGF
ncbi:DNA replication checkpoint tel2 [Hyphodiscus hymeniophilus]|uniref:DNA replication checkpoint tel2 n=1 Tax=Hyphodiscus hymeniophilus TaxID=353542 RepID=A0A9P7AZA5_9HELO|nr:DNA replication checkpoint tel2 [Hyphodiscus hymeniophilus]